MNAAALLAQYVRIADAPDAIERLRRFVLDLAVRGRLTGQDKDDEPASILIRTIQRQQQLVKQRIRKKSTAHIEGKAPPFNLPAGWELAALGSITRITTGKLDANAAVKGGRYPFFTCSQTPSEIDSYSFDTAAVLLAGNGDFNLKSYRGKFDAYQRTYVIEPLGWDLRFCFILIQAQISRITENQRGSAIPYLKLGDIADPLVAIPPLAEQHRIVAKVDELMALCDRLEAARMQREATRDRLAAASLARLNTPDPETFQADTRFAIGTALPALTTRPDQIKQIRQTILNLAVRGHLEVSLASDGNASELLNAVERITGRPTQAAIDSTPFDLPSSWCWSSVGGLSTKTGSGSTPRGGKEVYKPSGVMFLRSQNIYDDGLRLNDVVFIDAETHARMSGTAVADNDLLLNITGGSIGRCALVQSPAVSANVSQHVAIIRMAQSAMAPFVHLVIRSPYFQRFVNNEQTGAGRGGLPKNRMDPILVPVPPLAEQHRIVAKVDELMALCDQLEASLTHGENTRSRLLNALLHEALQQTHDNVIDFEAARNRLLEKRQAVACRIVERLWRTKGFGRLRAIKPLYLAEAHCGIDLGGQWGRGDYGPYDHWILTFESQAASAGWFTRVERLTSDGHAWVEYAPGSQLANKAKAATQALKAHAEEFERVLALLADLDTEGSEIVATLYAAWNDLLLERKPVSDEIVISEFREHWGVARKAEFSPVHLKRWLNWMREHRLTPRGQKPNTRHQPKLI